MATSSHNPKHNVVLVFGLAIEIYVISLHFRWSSLKTVPGSCSDSGWYYYTLHNSITHAIIRKLRC